VLILQSVIFNILEKAFLRTDLFVFNKASIFYIYKYFWRE